VEVNIPDYITRNADKIKRPLGICAICQHFDPMNKIPIKILACKISRQPLTKTRTNMLECQFFKEVKQKSSISSLTTIFKSLLKSFKNNDWKYVKEAINNELQN
jgi:hypothetical protein